MHFGCPRTLAVFRKDWTSPSKRKRHLPKPCDSKGQQNLGLKIARKPLELMQQKESTVCHWIILISLRLRQKLDIGDYGDKAPFVMALNHRNS